MAKFEKTISETEAPRLNADVQARIGHQLKAIYDDVLDEPVPDRIAGLLRQLEEASHSGSNGSRG